MARELDQTARAEARERRIDIHILAEERAKKSGLARSRRDGCGVEDALFRTRGELCATQQKHRQCVRELAHAADVGERRCALALDDNSHRHEPPRRLLYVRGASGAAGDDVVDGFLRKGARREERLKECGARAGGERCEPDLEMPATGRPWWIQIGAVRGDEQCRRARECRGQRSEQLLRCRVGPLHVGQRENDRLRPCDAEDEVADRAIEQLAAGLS